LAPGGDKKTHKKTKKTHFGLLTNSTLTVTVPALGGGEVRRGDQQLVCVMYYVLCIMCSVSRVMY
jgi:hypothetical protein